MERSAEIPPPTHKCGLVLSVKLFALKRKPVSDVRSDDNSALISNKMSMEMNIRDTINSIVTWTSKATPGSDALNTATTINDPTKNCATLFGLYQYWHAAKNGKSEMMTRNKTSSVCGKQGSYAIALPPQCMERSPCWSLREPS